MNLLIGVSGGIAAYRACELTSLAVKAGHTVRVCMTPNATRFVGPLSLEALSSHPVLLDTFAGTSEAGAIDHIAWARWPDVVVVAPASANTLARIACGLAEDALGTVLLAVPARTPVLLAPAMNTEMWNHPVTQRNLRWISDLGRATVVDPVSKRLACGDVGVGGLAEPADILRAAEDAHARATAPRT
jgi:phosphopantothenoylcysteine decarboxylase/phosphopantothenate--cysteine ligase